MRTLFYLGLLCLFSPFTWGQMVDHKKDVAKNKVKITPRGLKFRPFKEKYEDETLIVYKEKVELLSFPILEDKTYDLKYDELKAVKRFYDRKKDLQSLGNVTPKFSDDIRVQDAFAVWEKPMLSSYSRSCQDNTASINLRGEYIFATNEGIRLTNKQGVSQYVELEDFFQYKLSSPCDPRIIFDNASQRFIIFAQQSPPKLKNGVQFCLAVMSTNNPFDDWYLYTFSSGSAAWFDYPGMALTNKTLMLTGSKVTKESAREFKVKEALVYQIDLSSLLSGMKTPYVVWDDFDDDAVFLKPVPGNYFTGETQKIYLLGNNWKENGKLTYLYTLDDGNFSKNQEMDRYTILRSSLPIKYFGHGRSKGQGKIDNMDLRIMDAISLKDHIYFVYVNGDENHRSKVILGKLHPQTKKLKTLQLGSEPQTWYAFPALNWINQGDDTTLVILYNGVSKYTYPKAYCSFVKTNLTETKEYTVYESDTIINTKFLSSDEKVRRWGDYNTVVRDPSGRFLMLNTSCPTTKENGNLRLATLNVELSTLPNPQVNFSSSLDDYAFHINTSAYDFSTKFKLEFIDTTFSHTIEELSYQELKRTDFQVDQEMFDSTYQYMLLYFKENRSFIPVDTFDLEKMRLNQDD